MAWIELLLIIDSEVEPGGGTPLAGSANRGSLIIVDAVSWLVSIPEGFLLLGSGMDQFTSLGYVLIVSHICIS